MGKLSQENTLSLYIRGPIDLEETLAGLTEQDLEATQISGSWSIRMLIHHIYDGDAIWSMVIKAALANSGVSYHHDWYISDQLLSSRLAYANRSVAPIIPLFRANREHICEIVQYLPDAWDRYVLFRKPQEREAKKLTVGMLLRMRAIHAIEHIDDIRRIRQAHGL